MEYTPTINLRKPGGTDKIRISDLNTNADLIDDAVAAHDVAIAGNRVLIVNVGTVSSLPASKSDTGITANHVCVKAELGTPGAQRDDWTVTTSAGSVTVSGTISGSTTLKLYLMKSGA